MIQGEEYFSEISGLSTRDGRQKALVSGTAIMKKKSELKVGLL